MADDLIRRSDALKAVSALDDADWVLGLSAHEVEDCIKGIPAAAPTVQEAAPVLLDKLNTSDGFRAAANGIRKRGIRTGRRHACSPWRQ